MTLTARRFPAWAAVAALFLALGAAQRAAAQTGHVKVEIEGVDGPLADNVRDVLQIAREGKAKLSPDRVERLHRKAEADIQTALEPFGYYHARVTRSLQRDGTNWIARYVIDPGAVVKLRSVAIDITGEGDSAAAFRRMVDTFPLKRGDTLLQAKYTAAKLGFIALASDSGYLKADYDSAAILLDRTADTARIYLHYDTGPRATFGPVRFHETRDIIDTSFLATRISFKQGESFRHDKLLNLQASLSEDPYWARVEVTPKPDEMNGREVPIDVDLVPNPRFATEEGLGYGTDTGPRGHAHASIRWINRRGHNADATLQLGTIQQSIQLAYRIPAFGSPTGILQIEAGYERDHPTTSLTNNGKVRTSLLRKRFGWQETLSLTYQYQTYGVGVDSGTSTLLTPGISYTRTHADSKTFPLHGYKAEVDVQGSHQGVLANASFVQLHALAKGITSLGNRTRVLVRVEAGHDFTSQFRILPPVFRFFTGGDQTVRGFAYQTIGDLDEHGNVIGGPTLAVASVEGEYRFLEKFGVAVFSDVGSAAKSFSIRGLEQGVGAGLRWLSPVGMVRLDGAFAISRPGAPFRIHVSIGADL